MVAYTGKLVEAPIEPPKIDSLRFAQMKGGSLFTGRKKPIIAFKVPG